MQSNFQQCLDFTLNQEGGYFTGDSAICTMAGITLSTYRSFRADQTITCADLQNIAADEVASIYLDNYWNAVAGDQLPIGVDLCVFDFGVNTGPARSIMLMQQIVSVPCDSIIGPQTLAAVASIDPETLVNDLCDAQAAYYQQLSPSLFNKFGQGWLNRVEARRQAALEMI